jgi:hypothetical protein
LFAGLLGCGGDSAAPGALTEQDLYKAIAGSDVRYALLTRSEKSAEAQNAEGAIVQYAGIEDMDALAAVLSKEHIEYQLQDQRVAAMPE